MELTNTTHWQNTRATGAHSEVMLTPQRKSVKTIIFETEVLPDGGYGKKTKHPARRAVNARAGRFC